MFLWIIKIFRFVLYYRMSDPDIERRIREIEDEIRRTQYNKATQYHIGKLRAKLAQLRDELKKRKSTKTGKGRYGVKKTGDASVILVGFPSVGKSTLLNKLTDAKSKIGDYEFTTLDVIPGIMNYKGAKIQILDLPGIITDSSLGKGRGKEIMSIIRTADLVLILLDINKPEQIDIIKKELYESGLRINEKRPNVKIRKANRGGIIINSSIKLKRLDEKTIKSILGIYGIHSAEIIFHEDIDENQLVDIIMNNRVYIPSITAVNKIDSVNKKRLNDVKSVIGEDAIFISAKYGINIEELQEEIFKKLEFIRIYLKPHNKDKDVDYEKPLILKKGSTVLDVCRKIHKDFERNFRYARIWGKSVRFDGQKKGLEHVVHDGDLVSIITKR